MAKRKEVVHIHYVHHIIHSSPAAQAIMVSPIMAGASAPNIMVHASMPGQPRADIMTAPGYYNATPPEPEDKTS